MLALNDERWNQLTTFFPPDAGIPEVLKKWLAVVGTEEEDRIYHREIFDLYLHQVTITNAAFAIVPWIVDVCKRDHTKLRVHYLHDVALVEMCRQVQGLYFNRDGTEPFPDWLMPDYHLAIRNARILVENSLDQETDELALKYLNAVKPVFYGDVEKAWKNW